MNRVPRLAKVELYKFFVTRSTTSLSIGSFAVAVAIVLGTNLYLLSEGEPLSVGGALSLATLPVGLLVPVTAILIFASDWQHRDVTTYFAISEKRSAIFIAKIVASLIISVVVLVGVLAVTWLSTFALAQLSGSDVSWEAGEPVKNLVAAVVVGTICGAAIGAALMSAALAIAFTIVQTLLIDPLLGFVPNGVGEYFRIASITGDWVALSSPWAVVSSAIVWIALPLAIGAVRFQRREP